MPPRVGIRNSLIFEGRRNIHKKKLLLLVALDG